jgi:hypothetical protein
MEGFSKPLRELTQMPSLLSPFKSRAWIRVEKRRLSEEAIGTARWGWGGLAQRRRGAEAQRGDREERECWAVESAFCDCLGQQATDNPQNPFGKGWDQGMDPTHSHGQVENATAPSAGGSPDGGDSRRGAEAERGDGEDRVGMRAFSDGISHRGHRVHREILRFAIDETDLLQLGCGRTRAEAQRWG